MALIKQKLLTNGVVGDYWKITRFNFDKPKLSVSYLVELFRDATYRDIAPVCDIKKTFVFTITKTQSTENLLALGYTLIKDYANTVKIPAADGHPAIHKDEDLFDAVDG